MTQDPRKPREIQSRTANRDGWTPPSVLPDPPYDKDWVFRWVRVDTMGTPDNRNVSLRMREGWVPCRAEDFPDIVASLMPNSPRGETPSQNRDVAANGNIVVGGLMLCKMDRERAKQRQEYFAEMATRQLEGVDKSPLKELHPHMPVVNTSRTKVKFGKGSSRDE